jgi:hypothetical protein
MIRRIRRAKLFGFLRQQRHVLCAEALPHELATLYKAQAHGQPPVPPAPLALATILQASTPVADDAGIAATTLARRWPLVLDCLDGDTPPCSTGTLVAFRQRVLSQQLARRLIARTLEGAASRGAFGARQWRAALASRPLWGASRVEETDNLLGHALRKALGVIARQQGRGLPAVATEAHAPLGGGTRLKAALDLDWDAPTARDPALHLILKPLTAVEHWLALQPELTAAPRGPASLAVAPQGCPPDVPTAPEGAPTLRQGVAADRRMTSAAAAMHHGRKSRSLRVEGSKRPIRRDVDSGVVVAVGVTPATAPEASVTAASTTDLTAQQATVKEWPIDRA